MIKAIFFDFNGVIIDDEPIQMLAYQQVLNDEEITLTENDYYAALGLNDTFFVRGAFERAGRELTSDKLNAIIERKTDSHRKMLENELPIFPGVVTFVKATSRHLSLAIVSMARRVEIDEVLTRAGLKGLFSVVVSSEDVETCKPDPACYLRGFSLLNEMLRKKGMPGISAAECLAIEDAPPGIESARAAGMRTLGMTNTVPAEALRAAGADVVTKSLVDWTVDAVFRVYDE